MSLILPLYLSLSFTHNTGTGYSSSLPVVWQSWGLCDSVTAVMYGCFHPSARPKWIITHQIRVTYLYLSLYPILSGPLPAFPDSHWLSVCVLLIFLPRRFPLSHPFSPLSCGTCRKSGAVSVLVASRGSPPPCIASAHHRARADVMKSRSHTNLLRN